MATGAKRNWLSWHLLLAMALAFSFLATDRVSPKAVALCAPSMCPMKAKVYCHQSSSAANSTHGPALRKAPSSCCEVSPSIPVLPGEVLPKLTVETFKFQFYARASDLATVASDVRSYPSSSAPSAFDFRLDRSDTYLHSSILRI